MDFDFPLPPLPGEILPEAEPEPDWKIYEHSIAHIEESYENCKVTRNHKPVGRRSGVQRQVDVWLEAEVGDNHIVTVAIECRRYADRPVSIKDIDAFCGFLDDVGANKGVIAQPERRTFKQFFEAAPPDSRERQPEGKPLVGTQFNSCLCAPLGGLPVPAEHMGCGNKAQRPS